jgi:hypothetical protein
MSNFPSIISAVSNADELAAMGIMVADDDLAPPDDAVAPPPAADEDSPADQKEDAG